jgi:hypothetical protein
MAFDLGDPADQKAVDRLFDGILDALESGDANRDQARFLLGHVLILAGKGDEKAVRDWLDIERIAKWRKDSRAVRS